MRLWATRVCTSCQLPWTWRRGRLPVDVVLGGYHLAGAAMERRIDDTVADLRELVQPRIVAPGHCTGWRAKVALARAFAPGRYGPSSVGTTYDLDAAPD